MTNINPIIRWWVTPELPPEDVFARHNFVSQWLLHPIKRRLARIWIRILQKRGTKVIGITGSTGKTTTTEILASILKKDGKTVWSAEGVDPVYNIPNTILKAPLSTKYIILEMSVEYVNEMNFYLWLVKPDVSIITNISQTHTQFLGDTIGVAAEKSKIVKVLGENDTAVLNREDTIVSSFANLVKSKIRWFGQGSDISASKIELQDNLSTSFTLNIGEDKKSVHMDVFGKQFVVNALAAAAAAHSLGIEIETIVGGIENFKRPSHRLNIIKSKKYGIIFDDTYNSNPKAAQESLETFLKLSGNKTKIAVIGDMLELGKFEEEAHRNLGKSIGKQSFKFLIGVGPASRFLIEEAAKLMGDDKCFLTTNYKEAIGIVKPILNSKTALFVKGSRSIYLDKLIDALV